MPVLTLAHIAKTYRDSWGRKTTALRDVTLEVQPGEVFGLMGPNGAGKTTAFKIILGLLRPSAGTGSLLGHPLGSREARRRLGFLPENPYFYDYLTPREFLHTCGELSGLSRPERNRRIPELLGQVGLDPGENRRLRKFSKGMLQRIGLAQALLHDPDLLILDEPMSGLDPAGRSLFRDLILGLKERGKTVLFASHILSDVEALCDRIAILDRGSVRRTGRVGEMVSPAARGYEIEASGLPDALVRAWTEEGVLRAGGDRVIVRAADENDLKRRIAAILEYEGSLLLGVRGLRESLEEVFLHEIHHDDDLGRAA